MACYWYPMARRSVRRGVAVAILALAALNGCNRTRHLEATLPDTGHDYLVTAIARDDPAGTLPVLAHTQLLPIASGATGLEVSGASDDDMRLVVFLFAADPSPPSSAYRPRRCRTS